MVSSLPKYPHGATRVPGGAPLPSYISSHHGDGNWDDEFYGQTNMKHGAGRRYCCFPDCAWSVSMHSVACQAHTALVGPERVRAAGNLADHKATVDAQPFEYDMAVELLVAEMQVAVEKRMFG